MAQATADRTRMPQSPLHHWSDLVRRALGAGVGLLILFAFLLAGAPAARAQDLQARAGVIELGPQALTGSVELRGEWGFGWQQFQDPQARAMPPALARVPGDWNELAAGGKPPGPDGWATYALQVRCPEGTRLAVAMPMQRTAARLYVNGRLATAQGSPGATAADTEAAIGPRVLLTPPQACPLRLTVHIANHAHRAGGFIRVPVIGPPEVLAQQLRQHLVLDAILLGGYLVLAGIAFIYFLARRKDVVPLLFGLFSLALAVYADMTGERLLLQLFAEETAWEAYLKIEYVAWFLVMASFMQLVNKLFERELHQEVVRLVLAACGLCIFIVLLTPARMFSHLAAPGQVLGVAMAAYVTFAIARAARHGRDDAGVLLAGVAFLCAVVVIDVVQYRLGWASRSISPFGLLGFVLSPAVVLARRLARALGHEEKLSAEQRERADLLVRATLAGILDWDDARNLTTYSPRLKEIMGYPPDADTSHWPPFFERIHPYDRESVHNAFIRQLKTRKVVNGEVRHEAKDYRLIRRDGTHVWVHAEAISLRGRDGRMLRYICSFLDITDHRAVAESLKRQNTALAENARLREDMERMSRHDLKTPLNSIIGVTRLLREDARLLPEHQELLGITERAGYRMLDMVNLSLDLAKMELGSYDFRPQAVNLVDVVSRVMLDTHNLAEANQVQLRVDRAFQQPVYARAEELLCYSIIANLLKNAVEATPPGGVVTVGLEAGEPVRLWVHNPSTVPSAVAARFFEKYVSAGKSGGTGLGTYSARLMAQIQEGDLQMRTSAAEGTTLTLTLRPLGAEQLPPPRPTLEPLAGQAAAAPVDVSDFVPRRVLVADDDEYNRLLLRRYLPTPPFTVEAVAHGQAAVDAVMRQWPDIVLIDMEMPVMNGVEAVTWIRAQEAREGRAPCVIVMLSSNDDSHSIQKGLRAGCNRYLTKPVTREALLAVMHDLDQAGHSHPTPLETPPPSMAPPPGLLPGEKPPPVSPAQPVAVSPELEDQLDDFLDTRRALVGDMVTALAAGDRKRLRDLAHKAAGGLALFGFEWAAWQARRIEREAEQAAADWLAREIDLLQAHLRDVVLA